MALYSVMVNIILTLLNIYLYILIATGFISFVPELSSTQVGQLLTRITEPYLRPFRRFVPPIRVGGIMWDLAFVVGVIVYFFLQEVVSNILQMLLIHLV